MPLLRSTNVANAGHVDSSRALTVYAGSTTKPSLARWDPPLSCASVRECPLTAVGRGPEEADSGRVAVGCLCPRHGEREVDGLIEAQSAALSPCRVERLVPERFSGLGDCRVELFLLRLD